jgi:hypothetical protein
MCLKKSKTDQEGVTSTEQLPRGIHKETCSVRALRAWIKAASIMAARCASVINPVNDKNNKERPFTQNPGHLPTAVHISWACHPA